MSKADDKQMAVAQVYSRAMHDLAESKGEGEGLLDELRELVRYLDQTPEFATFVNSPMVDAGDREQALERIFRGKASDLLVDSLQVINRKGRLALLPAITEAYHERHQEHLGRVDVRVTTAVPLGESLRDRLLSALAVHSGKQPVLIEEVDTSLIGGIVLRVEDEKIDASVVHEIDRLHRVLRDRAVHEIHQSRREAAG